MPDIDSDALNSRAPLQGAMDQRGSPGADNARERQRVLPDFRRRGAGAHKEDRQGQGDDGGLHLTRRLGRGRRLGAHHARRLGHHLGADCIIWPMSPIIGIMGIIIPGIPGAGVGCFG